MKSLFWPACLAVATTASAVELKSPAEVAREWKRTVEEAPMLAVAPDASLREQCPPPPAFSIRGTDPRPAWDPKRGPSPFDLRIVPDPLRPQHRPRGAKPYEFNGEIYWLVPLTSPEQLS